MGSHRLKRSGLLDDMVDRQKTDFAIHTGSNVLVYLIHGVTGTPAEMHYVGKELARHGWDVYATTLPGHCRRLRDLVIASEGDWRGHVEKQLAYARDRYQYVFVAGLSAGALLALEASTIVDVDGVVVLSPTFVYDGWNTPWSHAILPLAMKVVPLSLQHFLFHIDGPPFGIKDEVVQARVRAAYRPLVILREALSDWWAYRTRRGKGSSGNEDFVPAAASKGYPIFPLRTLTEIDRLITRVRSRLRHVAAPTLILQAREDDMTSPRNASIVHDEIASSEKQLILLDDCYHVITVDKQKRAVVSHVIDFFASRVSDTQFAPTPSLGYQPATL
ncbi:MAG TPA: alpha/beta fold hydrolase [Nitrospiraceae bacterium]|nr:alpha/beta fold hydrolase [Nitrospiraceae bacterium]